MGRYLDIIRRVERERAARAGTTETTEATLRSFQSFERAAPEPASTPYAMTLAALRERCPDHVEPDRWQQAVEDGRRFLATWGEQAQALTWTARDLFELHMPPSEPAPNYRRLSRYDATGLIWLLEGREVIALTEETAAIRWPSGGSITVYRKANKSALGPIGDSLDDLTWGGH
jgi:hypothetical protein